jgi:Domain of unknown function (DUF4390)
LRYVPLLAWILLQAPSVPGGHEPEPSGTAPAPSVDADSAPREEAPITLRILPQRGQRAEVLVGPVLDDEALEHAVESGLPLRMQFHIELWRDRFIDALAGSQTRVVVVLFDPLAGRYVVRTSDAPEASRSFHTFADAAADAELSFATVLHPTQPGGYYYTASLKVETLSLSDLDELERWLKGQLAPAVGGKQSLPGAVANGLKRALIRVLGLPSRAYQARSPRFNHS